MTLGRSMLTKPQQHFRPMAGSSPAAVMSSLCGIQHSENDLGVPGRSRLEAQVPRRAPARVADTLRARVTVKDKRPWIKPDRGAVTLFNEILNQRSEVVCTVEVIALLATRAKGDAAGS